MKHPTRPRFTITRSERDDAGRWTPVETLLDAPRFEAEAEAVEFAERLNVKSWPGFDWTKEPTEAWLAGRS